MTGLSWSRRNVFLVAALSVAALLAAVRSMDGSQVNPGIAPVAEHPDLFAGQAPCPQSGTALANGRRAEELGLLRADRYAYSPSDGVRAVERFQVAEACYRSIGAATDADRVRRIRSDLSSRVSSDYAAARLNLVNALQQERWSDALSESRRLLLLTDHLRRHDYVDWLKNDIGRIAARASVQP
ncbi:MAG: hypothetical protein ACN4G0_02720 [Polyangiales bacterium]